MRKAESASNRDALAKADVSKDDVTPGFLFVIGIENNDPTIEGGRVRVGEMEKCGHYRCWKNDFALVRGDWASAFCDMVCRCTAPGWARIAATGSLPTPHSRG